MDIREAQELRAGDRVVWADGTAHRDVGTVDMPMNEHNASVTVVFESNGLTQHIWGRGLDRLTRLPR